MNIDERFRNAKEKVSKGIRNATTVVSNGAKSLFCWAVENPVEAATVFVPLGVAGFKTTQSMVVSHRQTVERNRIARTAYDPHTGMHWDLKRSATNNDRIAITKLTNEGIPMHEALQRRGLI